MDEDKKRILICGNYGASNLGDEAILGGLVNLCGSAAKNAEVVAMSANPVETARFFQIKSIRHFPAGVRSFFRYWFSMSGWRSLGMVWKSDLVLLGGGGLFNDERLEAVWIWFVQFVWFWIFGKKVFCIAQSVGPLQTKLGKWMGGFVFRRAAGVTVRDVQSKILLEKMGVKGVEVLADPAYAVGYDSGGRALNRQKIVVLTLRNWVKGNTGEINVKIANLVDWLAHEKDLKTVFLPFQREGEDDMERFEAVAKLVRSRECLELAEPKDYLEALEIIGRSEMVIGMRLHSVIFAVLAARPFLALSYSRKVKDFVATLGMEEYCLSYEDMDLEEVKKMVGLALENNVEISRNLEKFKMNYTYKFYVHEGMMRELLK